MRTDGDDWDITASVGATALGVAALRAVVSYEENPLIVDPYAHLFLTDATPDIFGISRNFRDGEQPDYMPFLEWMKIFIKVRTKIIDDAITEAIERGIKQVVILAAGLDTRAYRLAVLASARVFELDREQVLAFKHRVLNTHHVQPLNDRITVVADLRENWIDALITAGFDPTQPTCWVTEGLLPYLPGEAQYALAETVNQYSPDGSRWILDISNSEIYKKYTDSPWKLPTEFDVTSLWYSQDLPSSRDLVSHWAVKQYLISDYVSPESIPVDTQAEKTFLHETFYATGYYVADKH